MHTEDNPPKNTLGFQLACWTLTFLLLFAMFDGKKQLNLWFNAEANTATPEEITALWEKTKSDLSLSAEELSRYKGMYGSIEKNFKPEVALDPEIEARCLAIAGYYEARSGTMRDKELTLWMIVNRLTSVDGRNNKQYRPSICAVVAAGAGKQYESITGSRLELIKSLVWGSKKYVTPKFKNKKGVIKKADKEAWDTILELSIQIINGERDRLTRANHFVSIKAFSGRNLPKWVSALKPMGVTGDGHLMLIDYINTNKGRVYLTKARPYNPHNDTKVDIDSL